MSLSSIASAGRGLSRKAAAISRRRPGAGGGFVAGRGHVHKQNHAVGPRGVPPISMCVKDMDDHTLLTLAAIEDHAAREEILKRHIMDVDDVPYPDASRTFETIARRNMEGYYLVALPYKIGIFSASLLAVVSVPMVFHLPTVEWFNAWAVTTDVPELRDLETPLEVSIWAWNWMEPPLGTISFLFLCGQYIRGQMVNLGLKPYTGWIRSHRGQKLADEFPRYDNKILAAYSETATFMDWARLKKDRQEMKMKTLLAKGKDSTVISTLKSK